jgi:hypothetical protein
MCGFVKITPQRSMRGNRQQEPAARYKQLPKRNKRLLCSSCICSRTSNMPTRSNCLPKGLRRTSPWTRKQPVDRLWACRSPSNQSSSPTTIPSGQALRSTLSTFPVPQPTSSTRYPGFSPDEILLLSSKIRRFRARNQKCRSSTEANRSKNEGSYPPTGVESPRGSERLTFRVSFMPSSPSFSRSNL